MQSPELQFCPRFHNWHSGHKYVYPWRLRNRGPIATSHPRKHSTLELEAASACCPRPQKPYLTPLEKQCLSSFPHRACRSNKQGYRTTHLSDSENQVLSAPYISQRPRGHYQISQLVFSVFCQNLKVARRSCTSRYGICLRYF